MIEIRRILCPIDFSDHSHSALAEAEKVATTFEAQLVVVHVVEPVLYPVAYGLPVADPNFNLEEESKAAAEKALRPVVEDIASHGVNATSLVSSGTAAYRICEIVEEHDVDLVVMSTHGMTGVKHALLGSTAERVVRTSKAPVLTVKAVDGSK